MSRTDKSSAEWQVTSDGRQAFNSSLVTRHLSLLFLLHFDGRARVGELGADGLGLVLRDALLDGLGRGLDEVFGLLQPERGYLADDLDDVDLVAAGGLKDNVELGLLLGRRGRLGHRAAARGGRYRRRGGRDAEGLLNQLNQLGR